MVSLLLHQPVVHSDFEMESVYTVPLDEQQTRFVGPTDSVDRQRDRLDVYSYRPLDNIAAEPLDLEPRCLDRFTGDTK